MVRAGRGRGRPQCSAQPKAKCGCEKAAPHIIRICTPPRSDSRICGGAAAPSSTAQTPLATTDSLTGGSLSSAKAAKGSQAARGSQAAKCSRSTLGATRALAQACRVGGLGRLLMRKRERWLIERCNAQAQKMPHNTGTRTRVRPIYTDLARDHAHAAC